MSTNEKAGNPRPGLTVDDIFRAVGVHGQDSANKIFAAMKKGGKIIDAHSQGSQLERELRNSINRFKEVKMHNKISENAKKTAGKKLSAWIQTSEAGRKCYQRNNSKGEWTVDKIIECVESGFFSHDFPHKVIDGFLRAWARDSSEIRELFITRDAITADERMSLLPALKGHWPTVVELLRDRLTCFWGGCWTDEEMEMLEVMSREGMSEEVRVELDKRLPRWGCNLRVSGDEYFSLSTSGVATFYPACESVVGKAHWVLIDADNEGVIIQCNWESCAPDLSKNVRLAILSEESRTKIYSIPSTVDTVKQVVSLMNGDVVS